MIRKIISGGQTGVDRAALDAAITMGMMIGGWCPKDRRAEDGRIDKNYSLQESVSRRYQERTEWNVRDSDGTLILSYLPLKGGTALTKMFAHKLERPLLIIDLSDQVVDQQLKIWLEEYDIQILNVAGPRESNHPGIYQQSRQWMIQYEHIWKSR